MLSTQSVSLAPTRTIYAGEFSSLIGSNNTSPLFLDSGSRIGLEFCGAPNNALVGSNRSRDGSRNGSANGSGHYMRFTQVTPPRIPSTLHYYS